MNRTTIKADVRVSGQGLFTAESILLVLSPSLDQSGIVFVHKGVRVPAHINALSDLPVHPAFTQMKPRCTSVGEQGINIATIEHLLCAITALGITDVLIQIESENQHCEIPIMDGSAINFVNAIQAVGTQVLDSKVNPITIKETIRIVEDGSSITIEPAAALSYAYTLDYDHCAIKNATVTWGGDLDDFVERIAPARTFCLQAEADAMQSAGMFAHLSTKDMLVIGDDGPIDNTLRHEHECALHKLLDLIGDLALVGSPLCLKITAIKSGHAMAHRAAKAVVDQISL